MEIMREKGKDYTEAELKKYDDHAQEFYQMWIDLNGRQGMKNYIHMISSGHMYKYMVHWGNLTKYNQQG